MKACVQKIERQWEGNTEEEKLEIICKKMGWIQMNGNPLLKCSIMACKK